VEGAKARQDAAAQPATVSSLGRVARGMNFDVREVADELVVQALAKTCKEAPAAGEHDVAHEDLAHLEIARAERLRDQRGDCAREMWIRRCQVAGVGEEELAYLETLWPEIGVESGRELVVAWRPL